MFPSNGSMTWHSLPSTGSGRFPFPCFRGTMECCDILRPSRRAWLPSLGDTRCCARRFAPVGPDAQPRARGSSFRSPLPEVIHRETSRTSQVPGEPCCPYAVFFDPGRTDAPGLFGVVGVAPAMSTTKAPATNHLSGLNSTALGLAVYASSGKLPAHDAKLASGCWPGSTGRDWLPVGFQRKVSEVLPTFHPPFPSLAWRKDIAYLFQNKRGCPLIPRSDGEGCSGLWPPTIRAGRR